MKENTVKAHLENMASKKNMCEWAACCHEA